MSEAGTGIRRRYVDVSYGQVHVAECGATAPGRSPVVLLHQTPRSWDEYREVLPRLGTSHHAMALDTPGMGASDPAPGHGTIAGFAAGIMEALDALGVETFHLVGHHTGGVIAIEVASTTAGRIDRLVLSSTPLVDGPARATRKDRAPIDSVDMARDGSHLTTLWRRRAGFYPPGRPDLLGRFVRDALTVVDPEVGHRAVATYVMEDRLAAIRSIPTLLIGHDADPHAFPDFEHLAAALPHAHTAVIKGGMVPLEFTANRFADLVDEFLSAQLPATGGFVRRMTE